MDDGVEAELKAANGDIPKVSSPKR